MSKALRDYKLTISLTTAQSSAVIMRRSFVLRCNYWQLDALCRWLGQILALNLSAFSESWVLGKCRGYKWTMQSKTGVKNGSIERPLPPTISPIA